MIKLMKSVEELENDNKNYYRQIKKEMEKVNNYYDKIRLNQKFINEFKVG